jgi:integrase
MKRPKTADVDAQCVDDAAMHRADYVHPRAGSKVWQFYLPAPPDLIAHFGSQWACRKSLGTTDLREANARAKQWAAEWQHEFDRIRGNPARRTGAPIPSPTLVPVKLTPELIHQAAALTHQRMLEADEVARTVGLSAAEMATQTFALELEAKKLREAYASGDTHPVEAILPAWLQKLGIVVSDGDPLRPTLVRELVKARLRVVQARQARQSGELVDTPPVPVVDALETLEGAKGSDLAPADKPAHLLTLRDVFELWRAKSETPSSKSVDTALRVVEAFEEVTGNPPLHRLTWKDGLKLRDHFLAGGMSPRTTKDRIGWVSTLIRYEMSEGRRVQVDPWASIKVEKGDEAVIVRKATRAGELASLFSLPLFQQYDLPTSKNAGRDAAYWVPVLGVYTGARITELAQLLVADVFLKDGLWRIAFRVTYPEWQSLKNKPSEREIPLHPELVRLGFLDYCKVMRDAGHERLFPLVPVSDANNAGGALSKWFSELKTAAGWGKEHTFHSFRHGVETALKRAKEPKSHIDRYTGHAGDSVADRDYTHLEPEDLVETVLKVKPEGLELPRVFAPAEWTAPEAIRGVLKAKNRSTRGQANAI